MKKSEIYFLFNKPLMGRLKPFWIFKPTALSIQLDWEDTKDLKY